MFSQILKQNLERNGYKVKEFQDREQACRYICGELKGRTVGIGGSMTVEQMGLYDELRKDNDVYWHWKKREGMSETDIRMKAMTTDAYISSVNGISETGEIVNIDGNCNRLAGIFYGHSKVYLVVGVNKVEKDLEKTIWRARNIASPLNAKRLGSATPCAVKGDKCYDCDSKGRICKGLQVLWRCPGASGCEYEVVLIDEELGY